VEGGGGKGLVMVAVGMPFESVRVTRGRWMVCCWGGGAMDNVAVAAPRSSRRVTTDPDIM